MLSLHQLRPFVVKQGRHWKVLAHDRSKAKAHLGPSSCSVQGRSNSAAPAQAYETALKPGTGLHCPTCTAGLGSVGQLYGVAVIGSHSLMGLVCNSDGTELVRTSMDTLLAKGLQPGTPLPEQGVASTAQALEQLAAVCHQLDGRVRWKAVGTAALRDCSGPEPVADLVSRHLGTTLHVLPADEEGMLSFQGATADVVRARGSDVSNAGVVDFGGRSCEVVVGQLGSKGVQRPSVMSLPIGCVTLANMLPSDSEDGTAVQMAIKRALEPYEQALQGVQGSAGSHAPIVMTGGTVTTAAALLLQLPTYEPPRVHMSRITSDQLRELASQLHTGHAAGMRSLPGWLSESRMSTLPAGCWALAHLLDLLAGQGGSAYVSDKDLLDGLMVRWLQELRQRCDK